MPDIRLTELDSQYLVKGYLADRTPYRTPGIHTSDIIADLIRTVPSLAKVIDADMDTTEAMWLMGLSWEDVVVKVIGWGGGQTTDNGIICSPDIIQPIEGWLGECKCTWKSRRRNPIEEDFRWMCQGKTYCHAYGVDWLKYFVMYLNGDYQPPSPVVVVADIRFTAREIADNWHMMNSHKRYMEEREQQTAEIERLGGMTVNQLRLSA